LVDKAFKAKLLHPTQAAANPKRANVARACHSSRPCLVRISCGSPASLMPIPKQSGEIVVICQWGVKNHCRVCLAPDAKICYSRAQERHKIAFGMGLAGQ
jgi:hypothetical protein